MRTEAEMMHLILSKANADERIRSVIMNGSRANPNATKDIFQDYDIVYIVTDISCFLSDHSWVDCFGERIMLQMPENMRDPLGDGRFTYLMLFKDGNRIDLQLIPIDFRDKLLTKDSESILFIDKDNVYKSSPPASDEDYFVKAPSELEYASCCNNFWWCTQNVAKGIRRDELPYVMYMLNSIVYAELHDMIGWYIGTLYNFQVSVGKCGKYIKRFLDPESYDRYTKIYTSCDHDHISEALFTSCELFRKFAQSVAEHFTFSYPSEDDRRMIAYLKNILDNKNNGEIIL